MTEGNRSGILAKLKFKSIDTRKSGVDRASKLRNKFIKDLKVQKNIAIRMINEPDAKPAEGVRVLFKPDPDNIGGFYLDLRYGRKRVRLDGEDFATADDLKSVPEVYQLLIEAAEQKDPVIDAALSAAMEISRKEPSAASTPGEASKPPAEPPHRGTSPKGHKART